MRMPSNKMTCIGVRPEEPRTQPRGLLEWPRIAKGTPKGCVGNSETTDTAPKGDANTYAYFHQDIPGATSGFNIPFSHRDRQLQDHRTSLRLIHLLNDLFPKSGFSASAPDPYVDDTDAPDDIVER